MTGTENMRVLHMSSEKGWRGGEQQLAYLVDELAMRNVRNVLAIGRGSRLEQYSAEKRIPSYSLGFSSSLDLGAASAIGKICRNEKIDVIHIHSSKAQSVGVLSTLYGNRVPMVLSRRVAFMPGKNLFSKWKYNHRRIRRIVCVSDKINQIMRNYVRDPDKCVTVYSGVDLTKFSGIESDRPFLDQAFGLDPQRQVIVSVGALDESKDHFTFIATMERLIRLGHKVQGLIVGDGPLFKSLSSMVRQKDLGQYVIFAGYRKDVSRILLSSDIFLMTSSQEGLGTSILDAFLARIPVVATDAGGIPEMVIHERTGLIGRVGDAEVLSQNISRVLADARLRESLVDRAFEFVRKFSKEEMAFKTYQVYKEVTGK